MRAPPPIDISLTRFGCWRGALAILGLGTAAVVAAWLLASSEQRPAALLIGVAVAAAAGLGGVLSALRVPAADLRWDGGRWSCTAPGCADAPVDGELSVALDLGAWMLLRFVAPDSGGRRQVRWLPVQRRGLEPQWHALRCAVHAPRPAPDSR